MGEVRIAALSTEQQRRQRSVPKLERAGVSVTGQGAREGKDSPVDTDRDDHCVCG